MGNSRSSQRPRNFRARQSKSTVACSILPSGICPPCIELTLPSSSAAALYARVRRLTRVVHVRGVRNRTSYLRADGADTSWSRRRGDIDSKKQKSEAKRQHRAGPRCRRKATSLALPPFSCVAPLVTLVNTGGQTDRLSIIPHHDGCNYERGRNGDGPHRDLLVDNISAMCPDLCSL